MPRGEFNFLEQVEKMRRHIAERDEKQGVASGKKDDAGKQQWYAMPLCVLNDLADTFNHGVDKYGLFNCLDEFDRPAERFWDSMIRHLEECQIDPLAKDSESGCYHAACVAFNALMYLYHCKRAMNGKAQG